MSTKDRNRDELVTGEIYHVFNRGINRQTIFHDDEGYTYFLSLIDHCRKFLMPLSTHHRRSDFFTENAFRLDQNKPPRFAGPDVPVEIHAYCLMPNHIHLLLRQINENGISWFLQRVCDSYTKAYNKKYRRSGTLWEGRFKAKTINDDYSYLQIMRYIHLNPVRSSKTAIKKLEEYPYSSYHEAIGKDPVWKLCDHQYLRSLIASPSEYRQFVGMEISGRAQEVLHELIVEPAFDD